MLKRFMDSSTSGKDDIKATDKFTQSLILPVSSSLSQPPDSPKTPFTLDMKPLPSSDSLSSTASEGHILPGRMTNLGHGYTRPGDAFEDVSLHSNGLNEKLVQLLEKRKAREAEAFKKVAAEHASAMQRKDKFHMEQLELMDAAHHRTVASLELELDKMRSQLTTALTRWEAAEEEGLHLKAQLEAERKLRLKAEREQQELSSLLENELQFD